MKLGIYNMIPKLKGNPLEVSWVTKDEKILNKQVGTKSHVDHIF